MHTDNSNYGGMPYGNTPETPFHYGNGPFTTGLGAWTRPIPDDFAPPHPGLIQRPPAPGPIQYTSCRSDQGAMEQKNLWDCVKNMPKYKDEKSWPVFWEAYHELVTLYQLQDVYEGRIRREMITDPAQQKKFDKDAMFLLLLAKKCLIEDKAPLGKGAKSAKGLMEMLRMQEEPGTVATVTKLVQ